MIASLRRLWPLLFGLGFLASANFGSAQTGAAKPLIMPVAGEAGPSSWLFGQAYGNTLSAFNFGRDWYGAGQGLHFGIDLPMPCGTPLAAVEDGEVVFVDNLNFGSGPHNLVLRHPQLQLTTLYGHLLERPTLARGQVVQQGEVVGLSGDPDVTCDSRPHLHFEVRSPDFSTVYNPIDYIDAPWHMLASIGGYGYPLFQQDLTHPRRWLSLTDQPVIQIGGSILNDYTLAWPPLPEDRPLQNVLPFRDLGPLPEDAEWTLRRISVDDCCARFWWHPTDPARFFVIDGSPGSTASVLEWNLDFGTPMAVIEQAPPSPRSPDGAYAIRRSNGLVTIHSLVNGDQWPVNVVQGRWPALNADNSRLLWIVRYGRDVPGLAEPSVEFWISNLDGSIPQLVATQQGGGAQWIDEARILFTMSVSNPQSRALVLYDTRDSTFYTLGIWDRLRGTSVSPGGKYVMFYLTFQSDPADDGVYFIETERTAQAQKVPWFGAWRWRDAESVYYLPFDPTGSAQTLAYYHLPDGDNRIFESPTFTAANGEWAVSADGRRIAFQSAADSSLWLLEAEVE